MLSTFFHPTINLVNRSLSIQITTTLDIPHHPRPGHMSTSPLSTSVSDERFPFIVFKRFNDPDFQIDLEPSTPVSRASSFRSNQSIPRRALTETFTAPPKIVWEVEQTAEHDAVNEKSDLLHEINEFNEKYGRRGSSDSLAMKSLAALLAGRPLQP